jgi:hypothetical protein
VDFGLRAHVDVTAARNAPAPPISGPRRWNLIAAQLSGFCFWAAAQSGDWVIAYHVNQVPQDKHLATRIRAGATNHPAAPPVLEAAGSNFPVSATARLPDGATRTWRIREDSLVRPGDGR